MIYHIKQLNVTIYPLQNPDFGRIRIHNFLAGIVWVLINGSWYCVGFNKNVLDPYYPVHIFIFCVQFSAQQFFCITYLL